MAVVIQEFEAIGEAEARPAPVAGGEAAVPAEQVDRDALERELRQRAALRLRRWAH